MKIIAILSVLLVHLQIVKCQGLERISIKNGQFVDSSGNVKLFHGANYVNKFIPWDPRALRVNLTMDQLKDLGLNVVRLGVMWSGVQPTQDFINYTYLDVMADIVSRLEQRGIYTIIELHQDALSSKFGTYDGVPLWLINKIQYSGPAFPAPLPPAIVGINYIFALVTQECGFAYQQVYVNYKAYLATYWSIVSNKFKNMPSVLGYELMNEPWAGDIYDNPLLIAPSIAGSQNLKPLYDDLANTIRQQDTNALIFYEPVLGSVFFNGGVLGTGLSAPNNEPTKSVLSWHFYCFVLEFLPLLTGSAPTATLTKTICDNIQGQLSFDAVADYVDQKGGASFLTEFGTCVTEANGVFNTFQCELVLDRADRYFTSWAYWDLNFFQNENGPPNLDIIKKFSRVYPRSTSGTPVAMSYNTTTREFRYEYKPNTKPNAQATEIFVPELYVFTNGYNWNVNINSPDVTATRDAARQVLLITVNKNVKTNVIVTITPK